MHAKIIELINTLIKMSGEKDSIKSLNEELLYLDNLLPKLNEELETLTLSINDDKYFDASSEIIDRNIELSLKKKISNLQETLNKQREKIDTLRKKCEKANVNYEVLIKRIASCETFINILNDRLQTESEDEAGAKFLRLLEQEKSRYEALNEEIKESLNNKEDLLNKLTELEKSQAELEENLTNDKKQLDEVKQSLANKSSYIDIRRKEDDLNKVKDLETKVKNTEKRKSEILNSFVYKAEQAKELLLNNDEDKTNFLNAINAVTIELNKLKYLNMEDEPLLKEEHRQLESKKEELTTLIENKKYTSSDLNIIEERIAYLDNKTILLNKEIDTYKSIGSTIDNEEIIKLTDILVDLRDKAKSYEVAFKEYKDDNVYLDNEQEVELEKYNLLNSLIINYENDLQDIIALSNSLNNKNIANCEQKLIKIKEEQDYLRKKKLLSNDSVNIIEKEQDRKELKELSENIEILNNRLSIGLTPNQVLDQIEMLLFAGESSAQEQFIETPVTETEVIKNISIMEEDSTNNNVEQEFTFEKISEEPKPIFDEPDPEDMVLNLIDQNNEIFTKTDVEEKQDFSFSPLDNTGFLSFDDALNIAQNE